MLLAQTPGRKNNQSSGIESRIADLLIQGKHHLLKHVHYWQELDAPLVFRVAEA